MQQLRERDAAYVFTCLTSCNTAPTVVNVEVTDLNSQQTVIKRTNVVEQDDDEVGKTVVRVPSTVYMMEITLNFTASTAPFVLQGLTLALDLPRQRENGGGTATTTSSPPARAYYDGWADGAEKRFVVMKDKGVVVEALTMPGQKTMKVTGTDSSGKARETNASRLIVSDFSSVLGIPQPRIVLEQTSRAFLFPLASPQHQSSFVLGPQPLPNYDPESDADLQGDDLDLGAGLDELDISKGVDGVLNLNLTSYAHGSRSVGLAVTSTTTTFVITPTPTLSPLPGQGQGQGQAGQPLCAVLLPCAEYCLDAEALISADGTQPVRTGQAWRAMTGVTMNITRPSSLPGCL
jgi:hypothetical protein